MRPRQIAVLSAALELMPGCGRDDVATSGFASGPHPITSSSGSSGSGASTSSSGSTSGEDSGRGAPPRSRS